MVLQRCIALDKFAIITICCSQQEWSWTSHLWRRISTEYSLMEKWHRPLMKLSLYSGKQLPTSSVQKYSPAFLRIFLLRFIFKILLFFTSDSNEIDKHPEKRMKAAYNAFEEINLPRLKAENPGLRLSQLKQLIWKEWLKSPQNPTNQ